MDSVASAAAFEVREISPALGAEIVGLDLSRPLDDEIVARLRQAWLDGLILLFRNQTIDEDDQLRVARYFGEIQSRIRAPEMRREGNRTSHPEIMLVSNIREDGKPIGSLPDGEMHFHSDMCFIEKPVSGTFLYAMEVPREGGDTMFLNMYRAYESLPEAMKQRLAGLKALNSYSHGYDGATLRARNAHNPDDRHYTHPVVRTHPESGRKALYVNRLMSWEIEGLPAEESASLLESLFDHMEQPDFIYQHKWRPGDLVLWDNRCTLHGRTDFPAGERRLLRRLVIQGDRPF